VVKYGPKRYKMMNNTTKNMIFVAITTLILIFLSHISLHFANNMVNNSTKTHSVLQNESK
jgi:heme/copper-type cytochrome/quinol oxidase subunit 2